MGGHLYTRFSPWVGDEYSMWACLSKQTKLKEQYLVRRVIWLLWNDIIAPINKIPGEDSI